jgi:hypothetical protein
LAIKQKKEGDRIGKGPIAPLRRDYGDFAMGSGSDLVAECAKQALMVRGASEDGFLRGEYPWRKLFGSQIERLRHANIRFVGIDEDLAKVYVADAIEFWEPRAVVDLGTTQLGQSRRGKNYRQIKVNVAPRPELSGTDVKETERIVTAEVNR